MSNATVKINIAKTFEIDIDCRAAEDFDRVIDLLKNEKRKVLEYQEAERRDLAQRIANFSAD